MTITNITDKLEGQVASAIEKAALGEEAQWMLGFVMGGNERGEPAPMILLTMFIRAATLGQFQSMIVSMGLGDVLRMEQETMDSMVFQAFEQARAVRSQELAQNGG